MNAVNPVKLYTIPEAARVMEISEFTLREFVKSGQFRVTRVNENARPRISGQAILDFAKPCESVAQ